MKEENKCVMGCKNYHGGEIKHHKDCPFYPESFTERYEQMEIELANVRGLAEKMANEYIFNQNLRQRWFTDLGIVKKGEN